MTGSLVEKRIIAAIDQHKYFPTAESVCRLARGVNERQVLHARVNNATVRAAWHGKVLEVARRLPLAKLCDTRVIPLFSYVPEAMSHRQELVLKKIAGFKGRPSLAGLAEHVTGRSSGIKVLTRNETTSRLAHAKLIALLDQMPLAEITKQRLDRHAAPEISKYLDARKIREGVERRKSRW